MVVVVETLGVEGFEELGGPALEGCGVALLGQHLVERLDRAHRESPARLQSTPPLDRVGQLGIDGVAAVDLEHVAVLPQALGPLLHVGVCPGQYHPLALPQVKVPRAHDPAHRAFVRGRVELLGQAVANAAGDANARLVDGARQAEALRKHLDVARAFHEELDLDTSPAVDRLIVVSREDRPVCPLGQELHHPPLQGRQVLRFVYHEELEPRTLELLHHYLVDHIHEGELVVRALVQQELLLDLLEHGPRQVPVVGLGELLLKGDAPHERSFDEGDILVSPYGLSNDQAILGRAVIDALDVEAKAPAEVLPIRL